MAESSAIALGRYLRRLRERSGLSLARVAELTETSPEVIDKGTLSRLERGLQSPSIFRLGPLCRIYEISADALIEKMELDREVDRQGGPKTEGMTYDDLHAAGVEASGQKNRNWDAYAYFRDAFHLAPEAKRAAAWLNETNSIRSLAKNALAFHELRELERSSVLDPGERAIVLERMASCCDCLGDMPRAERYADAAITLARELPDARVEAYARGTRATVALDQEQWNAASAQLMEALATYRRSEGVPSRLLPNPSFEPLTLLKLAECALRVGEHARTRQLALAAKRMSVEGDLPLGRAYAELLLGCVDEAEGHVDRALQRWRKAAALASKINHPGVAFWAEVELLRHAIEAGERATARAIRRRLERLSPWAPRHIPAYRTYRQLIAREVAHESQDEGEGGHGDEKDLAHRTHSGDSRVRSGVGRRRPDPPAGVRSDTIVG